MLRTRLVLLTVAVSLLLPAVPGVNAAAAKRSPCQRMKAKQRDLAPHRQVVLAQRGTPEFGDIAACVLPRGPVRRLATWEDGLARDWSDVVLSRGFFVLIRNGHSDQYGGTSASLSHHDVRTGRGTTLTSYGCQVDLYQQTCPDGTSYGKVVLGASGGGALEITDLADGTTALHLFDPYGTTARVDDGPVDSLVIAGPDVVWTRGGQERRVPVPG